MVGFKEGKTKMTKGSSALENLSSLYRVFTSLCCYSSRSKIKEEKPSKMSPFSHQCRSPECPESLEFIKSTLVDSGFIYSSEISGCGSQLMQSSRIPILLIYFGAMGNIVMFLNILRLNAILQHLIAFKTKCYFGEGKGNPVQYSCLEKSHGQKSQKGYSPWGHNTQT